MQCRPATQLGKERDGRVEMIRGLGVDIVEIERIKKALLKYERFERRIFTQDERKYCQSKQDPALHYAARFAAKEAVSKALGSGKVGMKWTDIEVKRDSRGKPFITLSGGAAKQAQENGICDVEVSLSFNKSNAVASAIAIGL